MEANSPRLRASREYTLADCLPIAWEHLGRPKDGALSRELYDALIEVGYEPTNGYNSFSSGIRNSRDVTRIVGDRKIVHRWVYTGSLENWEGE